MGNLVDASNTLTRSEHSPHRYVVPTAVMFPNVDVVTARTRSSCVKSQNPTRLTVASGAWRVREQFTGIVTPHSTDLYLSIYRLTVTYRKLEGAQEKHYHSTLRPYACTHAQHFCHWEIAIIFIEASAVCGGGEGLVFFATSFWNRLGCITKEEKCSAIQLPHSCFFMTRLSAVLQNQTNGRTMFEISRQFTGSARQLSLLGGAGKNTFTCPVLQTSYFAKNI